MRDIYEYSILLLSDKPTTINYPGNRFSKNLDLSVEL